MNTYTEPEFLAVAETLGYHRVNQSSRMGGTALAATDGGVVFVRDWEKCATPDDVERLLSCYHSLERKNRAASSFGRMGGSSTSPAKRAASARNGAAGGRPPRPAGPSHVWTEGEVLDVLGDGSYTAPAGAGLYVRAACLPGEDENAPATFDVAPSWADTIGPHDDCDASVEALVRRISARFPSPEGWSYDRANGTIDQVATFGAPGWAPTAGL